MAGAPIAIADRVDTIGDNAHIFQNREVLALRKAGLVGKPVFNNSHGFEYDPSSRDPERWIGQLPDGSWAVALFNREDGPGTVTKSIDFAAVLGLTGPAAVRDLWAHEDLGSMTSYQVALAPHASVLLSVVPQGPAHFQAEVGAWAGSARFENTFGGHEGMGYVTGLDTEGSSVAVAISVPGAGSRRLLCRVANSTGSPSTTDRACARPGDRRPPRHGHAPRAEHAGLDLVADRAGHADHGGRHEPCGVQRRDVRSGCGQSRLPRPGLRAGGTGRDPQPDR